LPTAHLEIESMAVSDEIGTTLTDQLSDGALLQQHTPPH
jgi:hypothetical protein